MKKMKLVCSIILLQLFSCVSNDGSKTSSSRREKPELSPIHSNAPIDITILYGTDRIIINKNNSDLVQFGNVPANPGLPNYSVGYTIVSIPPNHIEGNIETPSVWKLEFHEDTMKHIVQKEIRKISSQSFDSLLKKAQNGLDAFIFVHGYNNSFKDAALRTAQLAQDIHLPITPIMFSWSSNGSFANYPADEDNVQLAVPAFVNFLKRITSRGNFKNIHLIAHSMGNRLISLAMLQLQNDKTDLKIDQIIMAAPDVYADLFKLNYADALIQKSHHITIYAAKNDWALAASKKLHKNLRLGELGLPPPAYVFNHIDIIDAVSQKTDFLGHDRFARSPVIISDIDSILKTGLSAAKRNIPNKKYGSYQYYYFK